MDRELLRRMRESDEIEVERLHKERETTLSGKTYAMLNALFGIDSQPEAPKRVSKADVAPAFRPDNDFIFTIVDEPVTYMTIADFHLATNQENVEWPPNEYLRHLKEGKVAP